MRWGKTTHQADGSQELGIWFDRDAQTEEWHTHYSYSYLHPYPTQLFLNHPILSYPISHHHTIITGARKPSGQASSAFAKKLDFWKKTKVTWRNEVIFAFWCCGIVGGGVVRVIASVSSVIIHL
jgi:hypothetical protein